MFKFITPAYWHPKVSGTLLIEMVQRGPALPDLVSDEVLAQDTPPASILGTAASQGAQALSATADFAVAATGSMLKLAWSGLVSYGPPLAQGLWNGVTTYAPPLAQGVWNGLKTYGPPAADALGKSAAWTGALAWEAVKWGGNTLADAAEQHHVKERILATGQDALGSVTESLVKLAHIGWEQLSGNEAKLSAQDAQINLVQSELLKSDSDEMALPQPWYRACGPDEVLDEKELQCYGEIQLLSICSQPEFL